MISSRIGFSPIGSSGLGVVSVRGPTPTPRPPARITVFIRPPFSYGPPSYGRYSHRPPYSYGVLLRPVQLDVLPHPLDRPPQPLVQRRVRAPPRQPLRLRAVGQQPRDLALARPQPLLVSLHDKVAACDLAHLPHHLADRHFASGPRVHHLPHRRVGPANLHERARRVLDEREVAQ